MQFSIVGIFTLCFIAVANCTNTKVVILRDLFAKYYIFHSRYDVEPTDGGVSGFLNQHVYGKYIKDVLYSIPSKYRGVSTYNLNMDFKRFYIDNYKPVNPREKLSIIGGVTKRDGPIEIITVFGVRSSKEYVKSQMNYSLGPDEVEYTIHSLDQNADLPTILRKCSVKFIANITISGAQTFYNTFKVREGNSVVGLRELEKYVLAMCDK